MSKMHMSHLAFANARLFALIFIPTDNHHSSSNGGLW